MIRNAGRLIIICGLPATGKTTLARTLAERDGGTIFSADAWMDALAIDLWDTKRRDAIEALQWQQARDLLALGGTAIIEWGSWGRDERDRLRQGARDLGATAELIFLDAPVEDLFARATARGREHPAITLEQFEAYSAAIERPAPDEFVLYDSPPERPSP